MCKSLAPSEDFPLEVTEIEKGTAFPYVIQYLRPGGGNWDCGVEITPWGHHLRHLKDRCFSLPTWRHLQEGAFSAVCGRKEKLNWAWQSRVSVGGVPWARMQKLSHRRLLSSGTWQTSSPSQHGSWGSALGCRKHVRVIKVLGSGVGWLGSKF